MELKKAIEYLQELKQTFKTAFWSKEYVDFRVEAIDTVLKELDTLQMNYKLLEEKFDGSAEEKVDKLTEELEKQKQVKSEMRKVAWEEGYNQGYLAGAMEQI